MSTSPPQPAMVLIVEDEEPIASALAMIVEELGYQPLIAHDGKQALEYVHQALPRLILTDYMMPRMNGAEFIAALRAIEGIAEGLPPIILMTAAGIAYIQQIEVDELLHKPFELADIEALLLHYLAD